MQDIVEIFYDTIIVYSIVYCLTILSVCDDIFINNLLKFCESHSKFHLLLRVVLEV